MKKESIKKLLAVALAATMAVPMATTSVAAAKKDEEPVSNPAPLVQYDFESGIEGILENDEAAAVVNSETIYVKKTADQLEAGEMLDANGLVYTGTGADAKYVTVDVIGTPTVIEDEEMGKVLQFDDTTVKVDMFMKSASAGVADAEATKALDLQIRKNDYYCIAAIENVCSSCQTVNDGDATVCKSCQATIKKISEQTQFVAPSLKVSNPFGGLQEYFVEYDELEDVKLKKYGTQYTPLWSKGVTISYWVKSTVDENGKYEPASVLRWENDNQYYFQADNYSKYLACKKFDVNYAKMSDADKALAFKYSPSGVFLTKDQTTGEYVDPFGLLDYYFEYNSSYIQRDEAGNILYDENGKMMPVLYTDENGTTGPVYNYALIEEMNAAGKGRFDGVARFYHNNPNYVNGFYQSSDGAIVGMYHEAYYHKGFNVLPTISEDGTSVDPGKSIVRYALEDGELQIDVDNSVFWVPDNVMGIDENYKEPAEYGKRNGMQNGDVFFMNSWQESTVVLDTGGTYQSAAYVALSPVSGKEDENEALEDTTVTKHSNAGEWHHVAITMQNDWVEFYVDGEFVDVYTNYSSRGGTTIDRSKSFKRFNKGGGMRYGFGSEKEVSNLFYGNYVCRLFMDWLADENSYLNFGGIGNYAEDYAQATTTAKVCMDDVNFFQALLNEEQIEALADGTYKPDPDPNGLKGDVNGDGEVKLADANLILKLALGIPAEAKNEAAADVNGDGTIALADANAALKLALGIS